MELQIEYARTVDGVKIATAGAGAGVRGEVAGRLLNVTQRAA